MVVSNKQASLKHSEQCGTQALVTDTNAISGGFINKQALARAHIWQVIHPSSVNTSHSIDYPDQFQPSIIFQAGNPI